MIFISIINTPPVYCESFFFSEVVRLSKLDKEIHDKMIRLINPEVHEFRNNLLKYRQSILLSFNRDPYRCPKCNTKLNFVLRIR